MNVKIYFLNSKVYFLFNHYDRDRAKEGRWCDGCNGASNLASRFNVSVRTIRTDVDFLSVTYPIEQQEGATTVVSAL